MDDTSSNEFVTDAKNEHESAVPALLGTVAPGFCAKSLIRAAPGWTNTVQNERLYAAKPLGSLRFRRLDVVGFEASRSRYYWVVREFPGRYRLVEQADEIAVAERSSMRNGN